ncbi:MAG: prepilin-type N-terminal cleavage/methylation domain-containing protein [Candidatus Omnitrophica bacterium]|nr:prepilin-type N-terminal cleavage/methylation domain-containing protein [Candidatus Omnitrophota bacterium]
MRRIAKRGFTLVEIMIVVAIIALLAAIAIPNVLRGRTSANESAAIGNLRALVSSLEMVRSVNQEYPAAETWQATMYGDCAGAAPTPDFGPPSFCTANLDGGAGGPPVGAEVQGYNYNYTGAADPAQTYTILVVPVGLGTTGTRCFLTNETGLIRHCAPAAAGDCTLANLAGENTIDAQPNLCNNALGT